MKRIAKLGGVVAALLFVSVAVKAATITRMANVTATVTSTATLTADVRLISNDNPAGELAFGTVELGASAWANMPPQYVNLRVVNNSANWRLRLTTKNFATAPSTSTWGFAYGALKGDVEGALVPLAWRASTETTTGYSPAMGDPGANPSVGWTFIKDQQDQNDPDNTSGDQSFAWVDANTGYCNIAYGSAGGTNVVALSPTVDEATALPTPDSEFKLFVEGNFNGATAANYGPVGGSDENQLQLDLIYQ